MKLNKKLKNKMKNKNKSVHINANFSFLGLKGRKAFIASFMVDLFAILTFALTILVFGMLYKWSVKATEERLGQFKGVTYSNYLAETYLRTPVLINDVEMTMAELIAYYDYNQTKKVVADMQEKGASTGIINFMKTMTAQDISSGFLVGMLNPFSKSINLITDKYVANNFDAFGTCYIFYIKGSGFRYMKHGDSNKCSKAFSTSDALADNQAFTYGQKLEFGHFDEFLDNIPREYYLTLIPSIDPRRPPIEFIVVYDLKALITIKNKNSIMGVTP